MFGKARSSLLLVFFAQAVLGNTFSWIEPDGRGPGDYALDRLGSSWGMQSDAGVGFNQIGSLSFIDGILHAMTTGSDPWISFDLDPWDHPHTDRYRVAAVKIRRSPGGVASFHWKEQSTGWHGTPFFCPEGEWLTLAIDLSDIPGWEGAISQFRIDPAASADVSISIDWVSLSEGEVADNSFLLKWDLATDALVTLERTKVGEDNWIPIPGGAGLAFPAGEGSHLWDTATLDSRPYLLRAVVEVGHESDTVYCDYQVRVNRAPLLNVLEPSQPVVVVEGMEFSSLSGDAWDMGEESDIALYSGFADAAIHGGIFSGTTLTDPYIIFSSGPIDAETYRLMAWFMSVSDETSFNVYWKDSSGSLQNTNLRPSAMAGDWALYTLDLSQHASWTGEVSQLRFDPASGSGVEIELDWVRLVAPQTVSVEVTWEGVDAEGDATISFLCQDSFGVEYPVASGMAMDRLQGQIELDLWALNPGLYSLKASLDDLAHPVLDDPAAGEIAVQMRLNSPPTVTVLTPDEQSPRLPDVPEFSRDVLEDPWDFSELSDGILYQNMGDVTIEDGMLVGTSTSGDPYFWLLHQGYNSAQNIGKTGQTYPIDPAKYKLVSWRMYLSTPSFMNITWFRGASATDTVESACSEVMPVLAGWHVYRARLDSLNVTGTGGLGPWDTCDIINGFRIDPCNTENCVIKIDWFRLSEPGDAATEIEISWLAEDDLQDAQVEVYLDLEPIGFGGQKIWGPHPVTGSVQSSDFCTAHLPHPGGYVYVCVDDGVNPPVKEYAPGAIKVNAPPQLWVRDPDELGPKEFALEVQGNSWDMDSWDDMRMLLNIDNAEIIDGVLWGTATSDDSQVFLNLLCPINTRRYGSAHVREWSDTWHVMRLLWSHASPVQWQATDDFVVYPGWNEYRISDMTALLLEPDSQIGWSGQIEEYFRIDPKELQGSPFGIDHVHLYTHDMADNAFLIKWELEDPDADESPVDLSWLWKPSPESPDSHFIATVSECTSGEDSLVWDMSMLDSGTYHVYCIADDGLNKVKHWARGVLILNRMPSFCFVEPDGISDHIDTGQDFATEVLGNEWDMDSEGDVDVLIGFDSESIEWSNGMFHGVTTIDPSWSWVRSSDSPINGDLYETVSLRLYLHDPAGTPLSMMIYWKYTPTGDWMHSAFIPATEGWHTYVIDLGSNYPSTWTGTIRHFRIDPVVQADVTVELDWVRLSVPGSSTFALSWDDSDPDDDAIIDLKAYSGSWQGDELSVATGLQEDNETDSHVWDVSPFPAGAYYFKAAIDDGINAPVEVLCPYPLVVGVGGLEALHIHGSLVVPDTLLLTWNPPGAAVSSYEIYRSTGSYFSPSPEALLGEIHDTSYRAFLGPAAGNAALNYFFRVTWVNQAQLESPPSNTVGEHDFTIEAQP